MGLKNLAMLPSYFDYIFEHLRQKARLRPELSLKFLTILGPNPARTRPEKPSSTYNSVLTINMKQVFLESFFYRDTHYDLLALVYHKITILSQFQFYSSTVTKN